MLLWALIACWAPELAPPGPSEALPGDPGVIFVEGGLILPGAVEGGGRALTEGRSLWTQRWSPGEELDLATGGLRVRARAPAQAACVLLFRVGLGDVPPQTLGLVGEVLTVQRPGREAMALDTWQGEARPLPTEEGAPLPSAELPAACPAESATQVWALPEGRRLAIEGPFTERSGETAWRLAVFR